jgi:hypothetical protein
MAVVSRMVRKVCPWELTAPQPLPVRVSVNTESTWRSVRPAANSQKWSSSPHPASSVTTDSTLSGSKTPGSRARLRSAPEHRRRLARVVDIRGGVVVASPSQPSIEGRRRSRRPIGRWANEPLKAWQPADPGRDRRAPAHRRPRDLSLSIGAWNLLVWSGAAVPLPSRNEALAPPAGSPATAPHPGSRLADPNGSSRFLVLRTLAA